jgi:Flp pilus assembly protein TadB
MSRNIDISMLRKSRIASLRAEKQGESNMLGIIAAVLIILWLLGLLVFHVTSGLIHIILVVGIVLLVFHFLRGKRAVA